MAMLYLCLQPEVCRAWEEQGAAPGRSTAFLLTPGSAPVIVSPRPTSVKHRMYDRGTLLCVLWEMPSPPRALRIGL